jgi:hypothetical protein
LNGYVYTLLGNLNVTSRPLPPLTLTAKYRIFDYADRSDEPIFPAFVVNDRDLSVESRRAPRFGYVKQNADLDARWRFGQPVAATVGAGWERWDRNSHREVGISNEYFAKAALDLTPLDWLQVRAKYVPSFRRIAGYDTFSHLAHVVTEEDLASASAASESVLLRKLDEADRNRHRFDVSVDLTPVELLTITPTGSYRFDDYINSALGLQRATTWSAGVDFTWTPLERFTIFGGYMHDRVDQRQRSRSREVVSGVTLDFLDFDWVSDNEDTIDTFRLGVNTTLIPKVLDWSVTASYETALGRVETKNPIPPTSGTAAQNANATAKVFPAFRDSLVRLDTSLRYRFLKVWSLRFGYAFERFEKRDFRTDDLNPFVPGVAAIFFGNDLKSYTAHILAVTLGYRF